MVHRRSGSLTAALIAGTASALADSFDADALTLGTVTAGRAGAATESVLGYLVNPLTLRLGRLRSAGLPDVLAEVVKRMGAAVTHSATPFDELVRLLSTDRERHPWFQAWSVLQLAPPHVELAEGVRIDAVRIRPPRTSIEFVAEAFPQPDQGWSLVQAWREDGMDDSTATGVLERLESALHRIADLAV